MSMSAPVLSAAMRVAMLADSNIGAIDGPALTALCDAIASTVVDHITGFADVSPLNRLDPEYNLQVGNDLQIVGEGSLL